MRKLLRFGARVLGVMLLFVALSPWLLYEWGLSRFDKMPERPVQLATVEQQAVAWDYARGTGVPKIEPMNPYSFVFDFFTQDPPARITPSESVASVVAFDYAQQQPRVSNLFWQLSCVALTIWLTRHWTTEELASAAYAYAIAHKWKPRKPRPVSPESATAPPAR